jgi:uroporphyrinogen-III synthase
MSTSPRPKTVAILEARTGEHLAELVSRQGAVPLLAPALEEVPDVDPAAVGMLLQDWVAHPFRMMIFQTGVGTRALFRVTDSLGSTPKLLGLLEQATVVVRGPKPMGELKARGVRIDVRAASPFTSETVMAAIAASPPTGALVVV